MSDVLELTNAQMLFWAGQKLEPTAPLYNMAVNISIDGSLDPCRFERALRKVIGGSDALMTVFEEVDGLPRGKVVWDRGWALEQIDFSAKSAPLQAAREWANNRCRRVFAMNQLLIDTALLKVGETRIVWYFNQHHLITDAWSTAVLYKNVSEAYADEACLVVLPSFRDYIAFQSAGQKGADAELIAQRWQAKVASRGEPPRIYGYRGKEASTASERIRIGLGIARSELIRELAKQDDVRCLTPHLTLFNIFSTVLFAWLYRVSGQRNLAIASPAHNRPTLQFKETIGVFIELFPLVADIGGSETFRALLEKLKIETGDFLRNARPGASHPEYNRSCNVVLNYINATFGAFAGMPTQTDWLHTGHSDQGHHLRLLVYDFDASGEFVLEFDANHEVMDAGIRSRMSGHFLAVIDAFLQDRDSVIDTVELSGSEECRLLQELGSGPLARLESAGTLSSAFLECAKNNPDRHAIVDGDATFTYGELERVSRRVAEQLELRGVAPGSVIPVVASAGRVWLAAVFGILRHGSAYVSVDPVTPAERFERTLDDTKAKIILIASDAELPCATSIESVCVSDVLQLNGQPSLPADFDRSTPDSLAYVLYTSGSTGHPKGVCISHRAVLNLIECNEACAPLELPTDCAIWTNSGFDVSVYEVFTALAYGHTLHFPARELRVDGDQLFDYWQRQSIASGYLPPFLLPALDQWLDGNEWSARRILVGVESIPHALLVSIARKSPGLKIVNGYGPTEATVCATFFLVDPDIDPTPGAAPVGKPLANMSCYILDAGQRRAPLGAVGELWISGVGLAAGYLNDTALTAERFRELCIDGQVIRCYRTGDAVRFRQDGNLEFIGRLDQQLKIRGIRIEPAEIQDAMLYNPAIRECAVKAVGKNTQIAAFFIASDVVDTTVLRRRLREKLPESMVPAHLIQVEKLPRTLSGKIDLGALPEPVISDDSATALPEGPVEEIICEIYSQLLEKRSISVDQSFIQLGGDSLIAMRALVRIRQEFDLDLPLHTVFQASSVREMSALVTATLMEEIEALDEEEAERLAAEN
jgi:amino acid adenylation domain-containing protein